MSLDITLYGHETLRVSTGIFVREDGGTRELSVAEARQRFPGAEIEEIPQLAQCFEANITHNLVSMASEAGLYEAMWRPEEIGASKAADVIPHLTVGISVLKANPDHFRTFNPANGWGHYEGLLETAEKYLAACVSNPDAVIHISR